MFVREGYKSIVHRTAGDLSLNGWNHFKTKGREAEFKHGLTGLKLAILVIAMLWVKVYLSYVFTLEQATVSISVKLIMPLLFLLLCAGDKSSQTRDIERAKDYWFQYKETRQ